MNFEILRTAYDDATLGEWHATDEGRIFRDPNTNCEIAQCLLADGTNLDRLWIRNARFIALAHNMMPHLLERIERLETAARQVVGHWDAGDLAAAVRNLNDVLKDYHEPQTQDPDHI